MAKRTFDQMVEDAAKWWADKLIKPTFNMGASNTSESLCEVMATIIAANNSSNLSEDSTAKFVEDFKARLFKHFETHDTISIDVDYGPDIFLAKSMDVAGIPISNAPWKTSMYLDKRYGTISVKCGYGDRFGKI